MLQVRHAMILALMKGCDTQTSDQCMNAWEIQAPAGAGHE